MTKLSLKRKRERLTRDREVRLNLLIELKRQAAEVQAELAQLNEVERQLEAEEARLAIK